MSESISYYKALEMIKTLSMDEQIQLLLELRDQLCFGFGMWEYREDLKNVEEYINKIRAEDSLHPNGTKKNLEEYLEELKAFNE